MPETVAALNLPWSLKKFDGYYIVQDITGAVVCSKLFVASPCSNKEISPPDASQMEFLVAAVNSEATG